jgi:hypothetical protein
MILPDGFDIFEINSKRGFVIHDYLAAGPHYDMVWPVSDKIIGLYDDFVWRFVNLKGELLSNDGYKMLYIPTKDYLHTISFENWLKAEGDSNISPELIFQLLKIGNDGVSNYNEAFFIDQAPPFLPDSNNDEFIRASNMNGKVDLCSQEGKIISQDQFRKIDKVIANRYAIVELDGLQWVHDLKQNVAITDSLVVMEEPLITYSEGYYRINHPQKGFMMYNTREQRWGYTL